VTHSPRDSIVWAAGVFEGGGAKGAAYAAALAALHERGIRFCSVAGSSAGALTAALLAVSCTPAEIEQYTLEALDILAPPRFRRIGLMLMAAWGLRAEPPRVRPNYELERLLERVLREKLRIDPNRNDPVTFNELAEHPDSLDLFIVAVDAESRREHVFNHRLTPMEGVANAAVSSAAIPIYFPPGQLTTGERPYTAVLFDGGVWSNFPTWIYKDPSFLAHHSGDPTPRGTTQEGTREDPIVLGMLLDEDKSVMPENSRQGWDLRRGGRVLTSGSRFAGSSLLLGAILAFTSPTYLFVLGYLILAGSSTIGCMLDIRYTCELRSGLASTTVLILGFSFILIYFVYQLLKVGLKLASRGGKLIVYDFSESRFKRASRSGKFISPAYDLAKAIGTLAAASIFALGLEIARLEIESTTRSPLTTAGNFFLTLGVSIALIVTLLSLAAVAYLAPAFQAIGRKVIFVLTSAGSARYWAGAARNDYVIRIPVGGLSTLSFLTAQHFVETYSDAVAEEVRRQIDERVLPNLRISQIQR
jgi:predicted acylesterase/phospholipase RssA